LSLAQLRNHFESVAVGHQDVRDHQVDMHRAQHSNRFLPGRNTGDQVSEVTQPLLHKLLNFGDVIGNHHGNRGGGRGKRGGRGRHYGVSSRVFTATLLESAVNLEQVDHGKKPRKLPEFR
jgi:hypothetical protein